MNTLRSLFLFAFLLVLFSASAHAAPPDFLQTNVAAWNKVLNGKIVENFHRANPVHVAKRLGELGGAKVIIDIPARARVPLVTRKYHLVTLREAFFLLSQDAGLKVDWYYSGRLPQAIRVSLASDNAAEENPAAEP